MKEDVDSWSYTTPACLHIDILAEEDPNTPVLKYYTPVSGILPQDTYLLISLGRSKAILVGGLHISGPVREY